MPVIYGVNKIDSIPIFVDTLNTDAKQVYVAYAICEGQIGGIYDVYFDDTSSVCIDEMIKILDQLKQLKIQLTFSVPAEWIVEMLFKHKL